MTSLHNTGFGPLSVCSAAGTIPTCNPIWNVTDGAVKRHAGAYSWEIKVGAVAASTVGFQGAAPAAQRANANQAAVTYASRTISDPPTQAQVQTVNDGLVAAVTLLNEIRTALVEKGVNKGGTQRRLRLAWVRRLCAARCLLQPS